MKGQVLGFDGTSGAITGEDGKRYRFGKENWKDERAPAAKDQVDFVAQDETAQEIYRLKPALSVGLPAAGSLGNGETLQSARGFIAPRPQLVLAALLLFASFGLNFMENGSGENSGVSLTGVHTLYGGVGRALDQQAEITDSSASAVRGLNMFGFSGGGTTAQEDIEHLRQKAQAQAGRNGVAMLEWASYLLWLIPLAAALIIFSEIKNRRRRVLELITGIAAVLALLMIPLTRVSFAKLSAGLAGYFMAQAAQMIGFGFGAIAIALLGLGLILTALGRVSRVPLI